MINNYDSIEDKLKRPVDAPPSIYRTKDVSQPENPQDSLEYQLGWCIDEIERLRRQNSSMQQRLQVFDDILRIFKAGANRQMPGESEDFLWIVKKNLDNIKYSQKGNKT